MSEKVSAELDLTVVVKGLAKAKSEITNALSAARLNPSQESVGGVLSAVTAGRNFWQEHANRVGFNASGRAYDVATGQFLAKPVVERMQMLARTADTYLNNATRQANQLQGRLPASYNFSNLFRESNQGNGIPYGLVNGGGIVSSYITQGQIANKERLAEATSLAMGYAGRVPQEGIYRGAVGRNVPGERLATSADLAKLKTMGAARVAAIKKNAEEEVAAIASAKAKAVREWNTFARSETKELENNLKPIEKHVADVKKQLAKMKEAYESMNLMGKLFTNVTGANPTQLNRSGRFIPHGRDNNSAFNQINKRITNLAQLAGVSLYGLGTLGAGVYGAKETVSTAAEAQRTEMALAGVINAHYKFLDAQGKSVSQAENLNRAIMHSKDLYEKIIDMAPKALMSPQKLADVFTANVGLLSSRNKKGVGYTENQMLNIIGGMAGTVDMFGENTMGTLRANLLPFMTGMYNRRGAPGLGLEGYTTDSFHKAWLQGPTALADDFLQKNNKFIMNAPDTAEGAEKKLEAIALKFKMIIGNELIPALMPIVDGIGKQLKTWIANGSAKKFGQDVGNIISSLGKITLGVTSYLGHFNGDLNRLLLSAGMIGILGVFVKELAIKAVQANAAAVGFIGVLGGIVYAIMALKNQAEAKGRATEQTALIAGQAVLSPTQQQKDLAQMKLQGMDPQQRAAFVARLKSPEYTAAVSTIKNYTKAMRTAKGTLETLSGTDFTDKEFLGRFGGIGTLSSGSETARQLFIDVVGKQPGPSSAIQKRFINDVDSITFDKSVAFKNFQEQQTAINKLRPEVLQSLIDNGAVLSVNINGKKAYKLAPGAGGMDDKSKSGQGGGDASVSYSEPNLVPYIRSRAQLEKQLFLVQDQIASMESPTTQTEINRAKSLYTAEYTLKTNIALQTFNESLASKKGVPAAFKKNSYAEMPDSDKAASDVAKRAQTNKNAAANAIETYNKASYADTRDLDAKLKSLNKSARILGPENAYRNAQITSQGSEITATYLSGMGAARGTVFAAQKAAASDALAVKLKDIKVRAAKGELDPVKQQQEELLALREYTTTQAVAQRTYTNQGLEFQGSMASQASSRAIEMQRATTGEFNFTGQRSILSSTYQAEITQAKLKFQMSGKTKEDYQEFYNAQSNAQNKYSIANIGVTGRESTYNVMDQEAKQQQLTASGQGTSAAQKAALTYQLFTAQRSQAVATNNLAIGTGSAADVLKADKLVESIQKNIEALDNNSKYMSEMLGQRVGAAKNAAFGEATVSGGIAGYIGQGIENAAKGWQYKSDEDVMSMGIAKYGTITAQRMGPKGIRAQMTIDSYGSASNTIMGGQAFDSLTSYLQGAGKKSSLSGAFNAIAGPLGSKYTNQLNSQIGSNIQGLMGMPNPNFDPSTLDAATGMDANGNFPTMTGSMAGLGMGIAGIGASIIGGSFGGDSKAGSSIGGALGSLGGPVGGIIGSLAGGLLGSLFGRGEDPATAAYRKKIADLLTRIDKSLRPVGDYYRTKVNVFASASAYIGGRGLGVGDALGAI